ncbi:MAG TPA: DNA primase [Aestuariivirgaceae bacterium]|jgi:DNA primase
MKFPPSFLDEIRSRVSVSSVIGRRVAWDRRKSVPARGDYWACCPFHNEKTPSFHADDRKGRYYCFGCRQSGDIFTFLIEKEGLSFPEAVERLAQEAGLPMPKPAPGDEERENRRSSLYDVMEMAAAFFEAELQSARGARARGYLADRGISPSIQQDFRLGYAPDDRQALRSRLAEKNVKLEQMIEAGLLVSGEDIPVAYDRFRNRVMFPIRDARGRVIAFGGRALSDEVQPKYLNSPETPLFHKGRVLYNFDRARAHAQSAQTIILVEGYMDVIAMVRAGLAHCVAPLGTAFTEEQLAILWRAAPEPILCFDGDSAGLKALARAIDLALPMLKPGQSLRFALLPEGLDPDDLVKSEGAAALSAVVTAAEPLIEMLWRRELQRNDRATPERRAQFEREFETSIGRIGDSKVRQYYSAEIARRIRELFGAAPPRRWKARFPAFKPAVAARDKGRRDGKLARAWELAQPASLELKALARKAQSKQSAKRRETAILLAIINHPRLLDDFAEIFAELEFSGPQLDSLRREIIDIAALEASLDAAALRNHLNRKGFGPLLERLDGEFRRLGEWFVLPDAAANDVRTGFRQMVALHRKAVTLAKELALAETALAEHPTDENLKVLNEIREQMRSAAGEEALIDGFGEESGRPQGPVA